MHRLKMPPHQSKHALGVPHPDHAQGTTCQSKIQNQIQSNLCRNEGVTWAMCAVPAGFFATSERIAGKQEVRT